jgi:hypothetical protein
MRIVIALFAIACGTEQSTRRADPPLVAVEDTEEEVAAPSEEEPPPPEVDPTRRVRVVVVPANVRLPQIPSRDVPYPDSYGFDGSYEPGSWPRLEPTDPSLAWLTDAVKAKTDEYIAGLDCEDCSDPYEAGCFVSVATPEVISLDCTGHMMTDRGGGQEHDTSRAYAVDDGRLVFFQLRDALLPGESFDRLAITHCVRSVAAAQRREGYREASPQELCQHADPILSITERGIRMRFACRGDNYSSSHDCRSDVAFSELDRKILADSPLGRALARIDGVTTEEVALPPDVILPGEERAGYAITPPARLAETLARWAALSPEHRADLRIAADEADQSSLVLENESAAAERARAIGGELRPLAWRRMLAPFVGRTRVMTNVRADIGRLLVPPGTHLAGVRGIIGGRESAIGARNTWAFTSLAPNVHAWVAGNLIDEGSDCVPSPERFHAEIPAAIRDRASRSTLTMTFDLPGRTPRPVAAFVTVLRIPNRTAGRFRVAIYERDASCNVGRRLHRSDLSGYFRGFATSSTHAGGGAPLVVVAAAPPSGRSDWNLYALGGTAPLFTAQQEGEVEVVPGLHEGGTYYPFAFRSDDPDRALRVRWDGSTLTAEQ